MGQHDIGRAWLIALMGLLWAGMIAGCTRGRVNTQPTASQPPGMTTQTIASPVPAGSTILGVFEGITPCSKETRPLPQIPEDTNCEQMIWEFTLYQDAATGVPTTYILNSAYGVPKQGTQGLVGGGTQIAMEGKWIIVKGTQFDSDAVVYQLNMNNAKPGVSFLKVNDNLLHVLQSDKRLMVGHGAWSYTINRMDNRTPTPIPEPLRPPPAEGATPIIPPKPTGSSILGVFEGRTPCNDITFAFTKIAPYADCMKIKWQLTLYQDQAGAPSTYLYRGTTTVREGTWTIARGIKGDPDAVVYQLNLENPQQPVSFLNVDDNNLYLLDRNMNLLVGDAFFSYTLSRTDKAVR
jgi:hypothetical protein